METLKDSFTHLISVGELIEYDSQYESYLFNISPKNLVNKDFKALEEDLTNKINNTVSISAQSEFYELEFTDNSDSWIEHSQDLFYKSINYFLRSCIKQLSVPEKFCIAEHQMTSNEEHRYISKIRLFIDILKLLTGLSDHGPNENGSLVFFANLKEGKTKTFEVMPILDFEVIDNLISDSIDIREQYEHLYNSWHLNDAHSKERQSVMLASLSEILFKYEKQEDLIVHIIKNFSKFYDRYCENYDIYVNRFSVEVQLKEIDEQYLDFIGKLHELIASSQTKALILPSVMVAMGALVKVDNLISIFAIMSGAIMTKLLLQKSSEVLEENLEYFQMTSDRAFNSYIKSRDESNEVKVHAKEMQNTINFKLGKARDRIEFIDNMSRWMVSLGILISLMMVLTSITK